MLNLRGKDSTYEESSNNDKANVLQSRKQNEKRSVERVGGCLIEKGKAREQEAIRLAGTVVRQTK